MRFSLLFGTILLLAGAVFGFAAAQALSDNRFSDYLAAGYTNISFNQNYIESIRSQALDLENPQAVFDYVYARLPDTVRVYPTENYYYFRFFANNQAVWGNIRLDAEDRDKGLVSFGYFGAHNRPEAPEDLDYTSLFKQLGPEDGVSLTKQEPLRYTMVYRGKVVNFLLHDVPQTPPEGLQLAKGETFMVRTFDESGFQFALVFDADQSQFRFILDETVVLPDVLYELEPGLWAGRLSGFAYYRDQLGRAILIGVD